MLKLRQLNRIPLVVQCWKPILSIQNVLKNLSCCFFTCEQKLMLRQSQAFISTSPTLSRNTNSVGSLWMCMQLRGCQCFMNRPWGNGVYLQNQVLLLTSKVRFWLIWQEKICLSFWTSAQFLVLKVTWEVYKNKLSHDVRLLVFPASSLARCAAAVAFLMVFGDGSGLYREALDPDAHSF